VGGYGFLGCINGGGGGGVQPFFGERVEGTFFFQPRRNKTMEIIALCALKDSKNARTSLLDPL
jgi:hypothetical protein